MEYQTITEILEALKQAGLIYNDADFCRKTGLKSSFVSEMRSGKKPFTALTRKKIEETFHDFFTPKTVKLHEDEPTLGELARMIADHDQRFHEQMGRIMDELGVGKKVAANS